MILNEIHGLKYQYFESIQKGSTVTYGNRDYRVQLEKKYLHIIVFENGKRKKVEITKDMFFEYGSFEDWAINGWWQLYDYPTFKSFAAAEMNWVEN